MHKKIFAALALLMLLILALAVTTYASVTVNTSVNTTGTITTSPNLAVYLDSACSIPLSAVNWGSIVAGGSIPQTVYVKNTGSRSMTLSLSTSAWSPSNANSYITVSWDKQGSSLNAGQSSAAVITLSVSSSITGITTFSNTLTLSGTG